MYRYKEDENYYCDDLTNNNHSFLKKLFKKEDNFLEKYGTDSPDLNEIKKYDDFEKFGYYFDKKKYAYEIEKYNKDKLRKTKFDIITLPIRKRIFKIGKFLSFLKNEMVMETAGIVLLFGVTGWLCFTQVLPVIDNYSSVQASNYQSVIMDGYSNDVDIELVNNNNGDYTLQKENIGFSRPKYLNICKKIDNENYTILKGTVIYDEMFYKYVKSLTENENVTFLGKGTSDNGEGYYYYKINDDGTEKFNYIVWIQKSSTAILLEGGNDQKETEKAFEHLTFKPYYSSSD